MDNFSSIDIENVLSYWVDVSQDPVFISQETGISLETVLLILEHLQSSGNINNFSKIEKRKAINEDRILLFEELVDQITSDRLKLNQLTQGFDNKQYFFGHKDINEIYDAYKLEVLVKSVDLISLGVQFHIIVTHNDTKYDMYVYYDSNEEVWYGSQKGEGEVKKLQDVLGNDMETLNDVTRKIITDIIPDDFWEVRSNKS